MTPRASLARCSNRLALTAASPPTGIHYSPFDAEADLHVGDHKAVVLANHGLLTVDHSIDEAAFDDLRVVFPT